VIPTMYIRIGAGIFFLVVGILTLYTSIRTPSAL
jgi:hypothetical protein